MKKNILIVTSYISGHGGIERVSDNIIGLILRNNLTKGQYKIDVLSLSDGIYNGKGLKSIFPSESRTWLKNAGIIKSNIKIKPKILNTFYHFAYLYYFLSKNKDYDYIITTGPGLSILLSNVRKTLNLRFKLYGWPHFSATSGNGNFASFKCCDKILCISKGIYSEFEILGFDKNMLEHFPNPFPKLSLSAKESTKCSHVKFVYIGRLLFLGQKRIKDILDAVIMNKKEFVVHIIGDGPDHEIIQRYINESGVSDKVILHKGWYENPWEIIDNISCLLLSSEFEGLPTVIGEALSRGIPCISSDCETGPSDFIVNGVNGYLYPTKNVEALSKCIDLFIENIADNDREEVAETMGYFYDDSFISRWKKNFS